MKTDPVHVERAARRFAASRRVSALSRHGNGHVHETFRVTLEGPGAAHFILQRLNTHVFRRPLEVMHNLVTVAEHIRRRVGPSGMYRGRTWRPMSVLTTDEGVDHWIDPDGGFWRALSFVEGAHSFDTIQSIDHARELGTALGLFHALIADLPSDALFDTLEGFHITPHYLNRFDAIVAARGAIDHSETEDALRWVAERRHLASVLEEGRAAGLLVPRPIHGDPKVGNVMIDCETGRAVSLVDLDTVKPGLIQYDIGDCLRSGCNVAGELPQRLEAVTFDLSLCRAILEGYLPFAAAFLSRNDMEAIFDAVRLIAFELGLRFLTDHLEGDVYFKTRFPGQNLKRALVQFRLCDSIALQEPAIRALVRELT